ncbi:ATP-dependent DNA helicase [Methylomonas paludis]|uniref:ATP-dependent DNA helicase n=1 Tax=Methylomonas paludis TaxID=1173101 RepID=UPI002484C60D|nr:AAA family ATPase [Methylomonas paludis]
MVFENCPGLSWKPNFQNCAVVAPTALAAINVGGTTIHSFFGFPPRALNSDEVFQPKTHMRPVIANLQVLIIDEVSMVSPDIIDSISNSLKLMKNNELAFGGISVVFVGDLLQLPPVISDPVLAVFYSDRYLSANFFSALVFEEIGITSIQLTRVFRQLDQEFVDILDRIRLNQNHRDAVARLNRECFRDKVSEQDSSMYLVPTKRAAESINRRNLDCLSGELKKYHAQIEGRINLQHDKFPVPDCLELKESAQVLFVKNNHPYWMNGTLGKIIAFSEDSLTVELIATGNVVSVNREIWEKIQYEYNPREKHIISRSVGSFKQFPVTLGWAITIHKSQGMTLDKVRIDLGGGAFCSGQTYVALSRCRTMAGITLLRPISMKDVKADSKILQFYQQLERSDLNLSG